MTWSRLPREAQVAWAAGLFDARGTVTEVNGRPRLAIRMLDAGPVVRFASVVGCGKVYGPYGNESMERRDGAPRQSSVMWLVEGPLALEVGALLRPLLLRPRHIEALSRFGHVETEEAVRPQDAFSGAAVV